LRDSYLPEPWQTCFALAWEAFCAGSVPVGAVVVDAGEAIVGQGRNTRFDLQARPGQLANTAIAHAEMNALATLPHGRYADHVLYTTLEPCLLCSAALVHAGVGRVRYAVDDPNLAGIGRVPDVLGYVSRRWPVREGPIVSPLSSISIVLNLMFWLGWNPEAGFVQAVARTMPHLCTAAQSLVTSQDMAALKRLSPSQAFDFLTASMPV
jgi:tRNA(Arg) A34 adenosine deaminase TadA